MDLSEDANLTQVNITKINVSKRKTLNISEKIDLIKLVDNSPNIRRKDIAALFGIPVNTVSSIYSNRQKILEQCNNNFFNLNKKKLRGSSFPDIEGALLEWYVRNYGNNGNKVSSMALREKALEIAKESGQTSFSASTGWIERFRARHNISVGRPRKKKIIPENEASKRDSLHSKYSDSGLLWENISNPVMELKELQNEGICNSNSESHNSILSSVEIVELSSIQGHDYQNSIVPKTSNSKFNSNADDCNDSNYRPTSQDANMYQPNSAVHSQYKKDNSVPGNIETDSSQADYSESSLVWQNISNPVMELTEIKKELEFDESDMCNSNSESHNSLLSCENSEVSSEKAVCTRQNLSVSRPSNHNTYSNAEMPTCQDVEGAYNVILNYIGSSSSVTDKTYEALKELKMFLVNEKNIRKQTKITDFFTFV